MNKKIVLCVICCAILLWCFRIISVNKDIKPEHQIQMGEEYQLKDVSIVPAEAHLFSHDEFLEHFNLTDDEVSQYDKRDRRLICVCLSVSNTSEQDLSWDTVMDETTGGFETRTWGSVVSPYDGRNINRFSDECLRAGQSQKIWFVTSVNTISFKKSTWKNMRCEDFKYVLPTEDEKTSVQLG